MTIQVVLEGAVACLHMPTKFDHTVHRAFKEAYSPLLDQAAIREIAVDLSAVDLLDEDALGMLMLLNERAKGVNKPVTLLHPSSPVRDIFEVVNFHRIFNIRVLE